MRSRGMQPDLVVLDLMLPGLDGIEVCQRMQQDRPVPVLMLTARRQRGRLDHRARGRRRRLHDEAVQRPRAGRSCARDPAAHGACGERRVRHADAHRRRRARPGDAARATVDGAAVHLTPTEFDLVMYLAARPGRVSTREELLEQVWGYEVPSGARTVDSHVRSVRRKLGADLIRTVHGVGYAVEDEAVRREATARTAARHAADAQAQAVGRDPRGGRGDGRRVLGRRPHRDVAIGLRE